MIDDAGTSQDTGHDTPDWGEIPDAAWSVPCHQTHPNPGKPNHDKPEIVDPPFHGAPIGGFGAGTIGRTYRGDFARWHLHTGRHTYRSLPACAQAIAIRQGASCLDAFALGPTPDGNALSSWTFVTRGIHYHALYPFAWFEGSAARSAVRWRLTQFSPILPNCYRETSLPVAVFRWHLHNATDDPVTVTLLFSWENGSIVSPGEPLESGVLHRVTSNDPGVLWMGRSGVDPKTDEDGAFAISSDGGDSFHLPIFDPEGSGEEVWQALMDGRMAEYPERFTPGWGRSAGALGVNVELAGGESREAAFSLAWHFPVTRFGSGRGWYRRYTRFYGRGTGRGEPDDPACRLAIDALAARDEWEREIRTWQAPILEHRSPALAGSLFNSLYILADGGSAWENGDVEDDTKRTRVPHIPGSRKVGRFSVLECFTYPYYATLDVRFYGAFPLLFFWPELERQVLLQYAEAAALTDEQNREMVHVQETARRKLAGTVPHDLGSPNEDPWGKVNAYDDIDPNRWKDLGPKFVLLAARYLSHVGWEDRGFLRGVWPAVRSAMAHLSSQDRNDDGLPEHEGIPDQTFDKWPMTGASAYTAGLTIAALNAAAEIATWCGDQGAAKRYTNWRRKAVRTRAKKLWTGAGFKYDCSPEGSGTVMAAQLVGDWAGTIAGLPQALGKNETRGTLEKIWEACAIEVDGKLWGLANGGATGENDPPKNRHAREVWPGVNYAVASHLVLAGLHDKALTLIDALARVIQNDRPYVFTTPEAWDANGNYRGMMYFRPLTIWAVEEALRQATHVADLPPFLGSLANE